MKSSNLTQVSRILLPGVLSFFFLLFLACSGGTKGPEHKEAPVSEMSKGDYIDIDPSMLVSLTDTICGMSLENGVADTLQVGSLIYGFCNSGCKRKFKEMIAAQ